MRDLCQLPLLLPRITFDWSSDFLASGSPAHAWLYSVWHLGLHETSKSQTDVYLGENVLIVTLALCTFFYGPDVRAVLFTAVLLPNPPSSPLYAHILSLFCPREEQMAAIHNVLNSPTWM